MKMQRRFVGLAVVVMWGIGVALVTSNFVVCQDLPDGRQLQQFVEGETEATDSDDKVALADKKSADLRGLNVPTVVSAEEFAKLSDEEKLKLVVSSMIKHEVEVDPQHTTAAAERQAAVQQQTQEATEAVEIIDEEKVNFAVGAVSALGAELMKDLTRAEQLHGLQHITDRIAEVRAALPNGTSTAPPAAATAAGRALQDAIVEPLDSLSEAKVNGVSDLLVEAANVTMAHLTDGEKVAMMDRLDGVIDSCRSSASAGGPLIDEAVGSRARYLWTIVDDKIGLVMWP